MNIICRNSSRILSGVLVFAIVLFYCRFGIAEEDTDSARLFDVVLLIDSSERDAALSRASATVVVKGLGDAHRLGVVSFGEEARLVRPVERIATVEDKDEVLEKLTSVDFSARSSDLGAGLELALDLLKKNGRKDAKKIVLLVSGGLRGESSVLRGSPVSLGTIKTKILPAYLAAGVVLHVIAIGGADLDLLQLSANITGGKCLAAPNAATMTDAIEVIADRLRPARQMVVTRTISVSAGPESDASTSVDEKAEMPMPREFQQGWPSGLVLAVGGLAAIIVALNLVVISILLFRWRKTGEPVDDSEHAEPSDRVRKRAGFAELRDLANQLSNNLVDAGEMVEALNLDLEDFGVEGWRREKALEEKYRNLARNVFLVIDHLDLKKEQDEVRWFYEKLKRILEDEGIEEMSVSAGEQFDGMYHKHVGEEPTELPAGAIIEVKRKGYVKEREKDDFVVLRQAEVTVSLGLPKTGSE
ncbi:MAG: nucleotide exchange factor GrpE [Deltaproteobacteria bacterium]|nr:nucleotide exchange factor GrpE [Deltaproteobacteria bacterium]